MKFERKNIVSPITGQGFKRREPELDSQLSSFLPAIKRIAKRIGRKIPPWSPVGLDDLINVGMVGAARAIIDFDPSKGTLNAHVERMARFEMLEELRTIDPLSQRERALARKVERGEVEPVGKAKAALDSARAARTIAYGDLHNSGSIHNLGNHSESERPDYKKQLRSLLHLLNESERAVLTLKVFYGFKGVEIAKLMFLTEGRVSQLTTSAKNKLRTIDKNEPAVSALKKDGEQEQFEKDVALVRKVARSRKTELAIKKMSVVSNCEIPKPLPVTTEPANSITVLGQPRTKVQDAKLLELVSSIAEYTIQDLVNSLKVAGINTTRRAVVKSLGRLRKAGNRIPYAKHPPTANQLFWKEAVEQVRDGATMDQILELADVHGVEISKKSIIRQLRKLRAKMRANGEEFPKLM